ncbi:MAG: molybdopterin-dependent oxidoreductase [Acidobacteriota bacterium]
MPTLTIDGKEVSVPKGTSVLEAAKTIKIHIPHYCYHPALSVVGNCRMCLVKIEGIPKLQTACSTPVADNMKVITTSDEVHKAQHGVMEFLLINHPLDCPVCDQGGECDLQDYSYGYGQGKSRYEFPKQTFAERNLGPAIKLNMNRCIRCTRCVRFCAEVRGKAELDFFYRGQHSELGTFDNEDLSGSLQGNLVDICPVGALTSKDYRFKARPWEIKSYQSICPFCEKGCSTSLHVKWRTNELLRTVPRYNPHVNGYWMCDHGRFEFHRLLEGDRCRGISVRSDGDLKAATREEAYAQVYEAARRTKQRDGGAAFFGLGSPHGSNEDNYMLWRFMRDAFGASQFGLNDAEDLGAAEDYPGFQIPPCKAPNIDGARDAGIRESGCGYAGLKNAIAKGEIKALFALAGNRVSDLKSELHVLGKLELLVVFELQPSPLSPYATVLLPAAAWSESDGTFTNMQGRVQRFEKAMEPPGACLPQWQWLVEIGRRFGLQGYEALKHAEDVFRQMSFEVEALSGLTYGTLGDRGALRTPEREVVTL